MAVRTPISATRSARAPNSASSRAGRPNSLTSVAPGAEKRSVIWVVMAALWSAASRSRWARRAPIRRAGITNTGSRTRASRVIDHDSRSITARVSSRVMTLLTTPDSVQVKARWAPMTSLLSRLTRAPVRVRVKKATGIRCTWPNTARRRSRISPSPIRDDCHRSAMPTTASRTATRAMAPARNSTRSSEPSLMMASTTQPASTGVATVRTAETTDRTRKATRARRCGTGEGGDAAQRRLGEAAARLLAVHGALQRHPVTESHVHRRSTFRRFVGSLPVSAGPDSRR